MGSNPARVQKRSLTSREFEVLQWLAEGKANKETADELGLTRFAMEEGIVESRIHPEPT